MSINFTIMVNYSSFNIAVAVAGFTRYNVTVNASQLLRQPIAQSDAIASLIYQEIDNHFNLIFRRSDRCEQNGNV